FMTAALYPPPIVVELVMGNAPAAWATLISTCTTASAPSQVVGMPGYWNLVSGACSTGCGVFVDCRRVAVLIRILFVWGGLVKGCRPRAWTERQASAALPAEQRAV